jgi:hypothetical protein
LGEFQQQSKVFRKSVTRCREPKRKTKIKSLEAQLVDAQLQQILSGSLQSQLEEQTKESQVAMTLVESLHAQRSDNENIQKKPSMQMQKANSAAAELEPASERLRLLEKDLNNSEE